MCELSEGLFSLHSSAVWTTARLRRDLRQQTSPCWFEAPGWASVLKPVSVKTYSTDKFQKCTFSVLFYTHMCTSCSWTDWVQASLAGDLQRHSIPVPKCFGLNGLWSEVRGEHSPAEELLEWKGKSGFFSFPFLKNKEKIKRTMSRPEHSQVFTLTAPTSASL